MKIRPIILALALFVVSAVSVMGQTNGNGGMAPAEADRIIRAFTTKEAEFRRALNSYSFKRDALIQSIGMGGQVIGEYHRVSTFTFDDQGNRYEKISFFPMSSMPEVTTEDVEDLGGVEPFALEPSKIDKYAVIGPKPWIRNLLELFNPLVSTEIRTFDASEEDAAWEWVGARQALLSE